MTRSDALYQWTATVSSHFPTLSKPQAAVLAMWSLGMVLAHSCALTAVSGLLAQLGQQKENTVRQRLREWCYAAADKCGEHRVALPVETLFVPLLRWILSLWQGRQLALAMDPTALGERFVVLVVSVLFRGCAIPVAWVVLPANTKGEWRRHWLRLLRLLRPAIPPSMLVIVLADRGLYARWLYRRIVRLGWHPFLRIPAHGTFCPDGPGQAFRPLPTYLPQAGTQWSGIGTAFKCKQSHLRCTLLALWQQGAEERWFILTDLSPQLSNAAWYGLRMWIEHGFKICKSGGWQWQHTRMTDPERAQRLWLAVAVATLWLLSVGADDEPARPDSAFPELLWAADTSAQVHKRQRQATQLRMTSIFRRGWFRLLAALLRHDTLPVCPLVPEPWPTLQQLTEDTTLCTS